MPDGNPYPNIADNFYALYNAEAKYPDDLRHRQSTDLFRLSESPTEYFVVFNACLQLDPKGITPFLPYVIRGDLVGLLDINKDSPFTAEDVVSLLNYLATWSCTDVLADGRIESSERCLLWCRRRSRIQQ